MKINIHLSFPNRLPLAWFWIHPWPDAIYHASTIGAQKQCSSNHKPASFLNYHLINLFLVIFRQSNGRKGLCWLCVFCAAHFGSNAPWYWQYLRLVAQPKSISSKIINPLSFSNILKVMPISWYPRNFTNPDLNYLDQTVRLSDDALYAVQLGLYVIGYKEFKDDKVGGNRHF